MVPVLFYIPAQIENINSTPSTTPLQTLSLAIKLIKRLDSGKDLYQEALCKALANREKYSASGSQWVLLKVRSL